MPRGGYRPGSGWKPGSGDPFKLHARNETEVIRAAREELTNKVVGTSADPLAVLIMIGADASQPAMMRIVAARSALPYTYSALPTAAHVEHVHTTADANILMNALMARLDRLTSAPVIDIEPTATTPARKIKRSRLARAKSASKAKSPSARAAAQRHTLYKSTAMFRLSNDQGPCGGVMIDGGVARLSLMWRYRPPNR